MPGLHEGRELGYKTRGNDDPQGKPKVYFCCHPEDMGYFDKIAKEILEIQDCAIFYRTDPYEDGLKDFGANIRGKQLVVVPVTRTFLEIDSDARLEIEYARRNYIPILPLLQEDGLAEVFTEICGDLQCLNKWDQDPTTLSYEEKLKTFLDSALLEEGLIQRIREEFDAYLFLSYRKKDREYARELIRLIHKNEKYRDIAVWFDEYLTPGESFNRNIREAMEKSDLFVLMVTPNLVEDGNYCMTMEYPTARQMGKKILPIEMEQTDLGILKEKFPGLPEIVRKSELEKIEAVLDELIEKKNLEANDNDPEHNYYIGLAYLQGIDVDIDHGRALCLLKMAAEGGVPGAMKKLAFMYRNGEGVENDHDTAIEWQFRYLEHLKEVMDAGWGINAYYSELYQTADYLTQLERYDDAKECYELALICMQDLANQYGYVEAYKNIALSYEKLGVVSLAEDKLSEAREYMLKALEVREKDLGERGRVGTTNGFAISYHNLAEISCMMEEIDDGIKFYRKEYELRKQLADEVGSEENYVNLARCCGMLGIWMQTADRREYLEEAVDILIALINEYPEEESYVSLLLVMDYELRKIQ